MSLFLFSDVKGELGAKAYHSFLVGGSVGVMSPNGGGELFFGPVVFGYKVVVDKASCSSGVNKSTGVGNFS